jgi:hypothetical protein
MNDDEKRKLETITRDIEIILTKMSWEVNFKRDTQRELRLEIREELNKILWMLK